MPLSEHELRTLEQLEAQLSAEDPKFASAMQADPERRRRRRRALLAGAVCLAGLGLTAVGTYSSHMWLGLVGMLVIAAGALLSVQTPSRPALHVVDPNSFEGITAQTGAHPASRMPRMARPARTARQRSSAPRTQGDFMQRMEQRWERRRYENQGW